MSASNDIFMAKTELEKQDLQTQNKPNKQKYRKIKLYKIKILFAVYLVLFCVCTFCINKLIYDYFFILNHVKQIIFMLNNNKYKINKWH